MERRRGRASGSIVAFSAICAHKLAYPTREVSFIRYQKDRSSTSGGAVIHCCADHSVYDPAQGARVVSGPAPQPLAAIVLEHEPASDELVALGTVGAEQFDAFFGKYDVRLEFEYGPGQGEAADRRSRRRSRARRPTARRRSSADVAPATGPSAPTINARIPARRTAPLIAARGGSACWPRTRTYSAKLAG